MNVGMFGGSFDPFHKGHLQGCRAALDMGCDIVFCIPSAKHADKKNVLSIEDRMEIISVSIPKELKGYVIASDFESQFVNKNKNEPLHTGLVYEALQAVVKPHRLFFIMGADITSKDFASWPHSEKIQEVIVVPRTAGYSSTKIRNLKDLSGACNEKAAELIRQKLFV